MSRFSLMSVVALIVFALAAAFTPVSPTHATSTSGMSEGCTLLNNPARDGYYVTYASLNSSHSFYAGDTITVTATTPASGRTNDVHFFIEGFYDKHILSFPAAFSYTFIEDATVKNLYWDAYLYSGGRRDVYATWEVSCNGPSRGTGTSSSEPIPGPEMGLVAPGSVMGLVLADTEAYYTPGELTYNPLITLPAGKTVWVVGMDATKSYYKIIWSATYLWVKVGAVGPNPDPLWQNWPLPDRIVE